MNLDKKNVQTIMKMVIATVLLCFALANLSKLAGIAGGLISLIGPLLIGACIAFVLNVPMQVWEEKVLGKWKVSNKVKRPLAIVLTFFSVILVLCFIVWMVVPQLVSSAESLANQIPAAIERAQTLIDEYVNTESSMSDMIAQIGAESEKYLEQLAGYLKDSSGQIVTTTFGVLSGTFGALINLFMGIVFSIYILSQKESLKSQANQVIRAFLKKKYADNIMRVCALTSKTFRNFITGQCLEAVILGTIFVVVMTIFRMPYALPVGVLIMLTALIPVFGAFIGCVVGALLILVVNPMQALVFVIIFLIIQQIEGNLIYPHVVGGSVGLPSIWVFSAVVIGGNLFGVVGMLVFIPACSVLYTLFCEIVKKRLSNG